MFACESSAHLPVRMNTVGRGPLESGPELRGRPRYRTVTIVAQQWDIYSARNCNLRAVYVIIDRTRQSSFESARVLEYTLEGGRCWIEVGVGVISPTHGRKSLFVSAARKEYSTAASYSTAVT